MSAKVLLCDEITSALDPRTGPVKVLKVLEQFSQRRHDLSALVTHEMNFALRRRQPSRLHGTRQSLGTRRF